MIRTTTSKVDLDIAGAGCRPTCEIEFPPSYELYKRAKLHIDAIAMVREDSPNRRKRIATLIVDMSDLPGFLDQMQEQVAAHVAASEQDGEGHKPQILAEDFETRIREKLDSLGITDPDEQHRLLEGFLEVLSKDASTVAMVEEQRMSRQRGRG